MRNRIIFTITCLYICQKIVIAQDTIHTAIPQVKNPQISKPFNNNMNLIIGFEKLIPDTCINNYKTKSRSILQKQNSYHNLFVYNTIHKEEYDKWKAENYPEKKIIHIELNFLDDIKSGKLSLKGRWADPMIMDQFGKIKSAATQPPKRYEREHN